jgi:hypothetical protein
MSLGTLSSSKLNLFRLVYAVPMWLAFEFLVFLPLVLLGWVLVPIAALMRAYQLTDPNLEKPNDGPIYHFIWPFMWVFDNDGDGIANCNYKRFNSLFKQIIYWSCIRNPVNNLRFAPVLGLKIEPAEVRFTGSFETAQSYESGRHYPYWFFAWQGAYSCIRVQYRSPLTDTMQEFWCGWKIWPQDVHGIKPGSFRSKAAGFAFQWRSL